MKHRWAALFAVLALAGLSPRAAVAQAAPGDSTTRGRSPGVVLGQNYPNPFSPTTTIPFTIGDPPSCIVDGGRQHHVTLRVYNVLAQLVAVPVLQGGTEGTGMPALNVALSCGTYRATWDGNYLNSGQPVPSGVYIYLLEVDGRSTGKKMIVMR